MPVERSSRPSYRLDVSRRNGVRRAGGPGPQPTGENNWTDLCSDLIAAFPSIDAADVIEEVSRARSAAALFGLSNSDQIRATATIARNNLRLSSGEADLARLDPETHIRHKPDA